MSRPWTDKEDSVIKGTFEEMKGRGLKVKEAIDIVYDAVLAEGFTDRSRKSTENRYYSIYSKLKTPKKSKEKKILIPNNQNEETASDIISSLENFRDVMIALKKENTDLREQLIKANEKLLNYDELVQNHQFLLRVIEQARRIVRDEDIEKIGASFRMDTNGNLEQIV